MNQGRIDPGAMRPWLNDKGESFITVFKGGDAKDVNNYENRTVQTNASLRPYEWRQLDAVLIPIVESRLQGIADLKSRGLVYNLGNSLGTTVLEWHDVSDALDAVMTMDGITRGENDRLDFTAHYLPIPIIHCDYEINSRVLAASRSLGNPLDVGMAERAARKVAEKLEKMLFTSESYTFGGGTIYSYTNYSDRNQVTLATAWDHSGKTGKQISADLISLKATAIAHHFYGPYVLYIPVGFETALDSDYNDYRGGTIRERLLSIAGISAIRVVDFLTADNVVLVQMTPDVVRLVQGMPIQNVQWSEEGKFIQKFKVWTVAVPQLRSDQNGNCGIVHATFSA
jgi:hypothetical protein